MFWYSMILHSTITLFASKPLRVFHSFIPFCVFRFRNQVDFCHHCNCYCFESGECGSNDCVHCTVQSLVGVRGSIVYNDWSWLRSGFSLHSHTGKWECVFVHVIVAPYPSCTRGLPAPVYSASLRDVMYALIYGLDIAYRQELSNSG